MIYRYYGLQGLLSQRRRAKIRDGAIGGEEVLSHIEGPFMGAR
jgi:hypothetical protein